MFARIKRWFKTKPDNSAETSVDNRTAQNVIVPSKPFPVYYDELIMRVGEHISLERAYGWWQDGFSVTVAADIIMTPTPYYDCDNRTQHERRPPDQLELVRNAQSAIQDLHQKYCDGKISAEQFLELTLPLKDAISQILDEQENMKLVA